jgi:hypothetical protein
MPRSRVVRPVMGVRISAAGTAAVDALAAEAGVSRSEMVRRLLSYAVSHMPRPVPGLVPHVECGHSKYQGSGGKCSQPSCENYLGFTPARQADTGLPLLPLRPEIGE